MSEETSKIVEVNGVKMELDLRTAKVSTIDTFKVGDSVKLLLKNYSGHEVKFGVIVGFEQFKKLPTIVVLYLNSTEMKYAYINSETEHEIIASQDHDLVSEKEWILRQMNNRIQSAEAKLVEEKTNFKLFTEQFGKYFEPEDEENKSESV